MTSYNTYSFLRHIRSMSWDPDAAEASVMVLPKLAGIFSEHGQYRSSPAQSRLMSGTAFDFFVLTTWDAGACRHWNIRRDRTFFNPQDGTLSGYAEGVLTANAAWAAWRTLVWLGAWYVCHLTVDRGSRVR